MEIDENTIEEIYDYLDCGKLILKWKLCLWYIKTETFIYYKQHIIY